MDLIYMNSNKEDIGVMKSFSLDLAFGADENDFELKTNINNHVCEAGFLIYAEGTEFGGIIDQIKISTETEDLSYCGRTWHGILDTKVLEPDAGDDYLIVSGEANSVIQELIERMGLSDFFSASEEDSGLTISNYKMNRYITGYAGIRKMLESVSGKLKFSFNQGFCVLNAEPLIDYSADEEFDSSQVSMKISKVYKPINHVICLGKGDLAERTVVNLYADAEGNISQTQTLFGLDEVTKVYDNANTESVEELKKNGSDIIKESYDSDDVQISFDSSEEQFDIGDIVGSKEQITGLYVAKPITKKIINIEDDLVTISYKVGD